MVMSALLSVTVCSTGGSEVIEPSTAMTALVSYNSTSTGLANRATQDAFSILFIPNDRLNYTESGWSLSQFYFKDIFCKWKTIGRVKDQ